jgi:hypothetical protein
MAQLRAFNGDLHLGQTEEYHRRGVQLVVSAQNASSDDVVRVGIAGGPSAALDLADTLALRDELDTAIANYQAGTRP